MLLTLINEAFEDIFKVDSRARKTTWAMFFKPGFLSLEYFAGRRARYVPPLRLYIITSIAFFLLLSVLNFFSDNGLITVNGDDGDVQLVADSEEAAELEEAAAHLDAAAEKQGNSEALKGAANALRKLAEERKSKRAQATSQDAPQQAQQQAPADHSALAEDQGVGDQGVEEQGSEDQALSDDEFEDIDLGELNLPFVNEETAEQYRATVKRQGLKASKIFNQDKGAFFEMIIDLAPPVVFILLPIFALLLKILYLFKHKYYTEHLVFAIHNHCFLFAALIVYTLLPKILGESLSSVPQFLVGAWIPIYMLMSLRVYYQQSWPFTLFKYVVLAISYNTLLLSGISAAIVFGVLTL